MSTESWLKNGVCRCCLFEGAFTSLEETFKAEPADITLTNFLKDTLDIDISLVSDNAATKLNTICDDCLQRLWDAALFKKQVLECEKKFSNIYNNGTDSDIEIKKDYKEEWVIGFDDSNDEDEKTDDKYSDDIHIIHVSNEDDDDDIKLESKYTDDEKLEDEQIIQIVTEGDDAQSAGKTDEERDDVENDDSKLRCLKQNKENACTAAPQLFSTAEKAAGTILTETKPYMCNICGIEDKNVTGLAKHIIEEHMEGEEYPCTPCQLALKPVNSERNHLKSHFETDIFMCTVCNKTFESEPLAEEHMQIHEVLNAPDHDASEELKYMCHVCGRSFMYEYHLNKHINVHSNVEKYSCDFCKKKYVSKDKFQKHECRRRRHVCDYCQKDFSTPRTLRVHIRSHTGEKPFLCTFCHKQFTQLITLKQHERMHTGEKRYKCDVCAKRFINAGNLKLHKRVHTSERPYSCDICKRSFGRKGNLVRHLLIDKCSKSSMKYITCEICKKQVSDKKKHMQLHYENKMLGCTICNKLYDSVQKLKRHKMMVHDKDKVYS